MIKDIQSLTGTQEFCDTCTQGKAHQLPLPSVLKTPAPGLLDLIHSDIVGPLPTSIGGMKYFAMFIDDHSQRKFTYFLHLKDQVFDKFVEFRAIAKNKTGWKIKTLHTNNGGEYTSPCFKSFLSEYGILHQTSVPHTLEQNGLAERANRMVIKWT